MGLHSQICFQVSSRDSSRRDQPAQQPAPQAVKQSHHLSGEHRPQKHTGPPGISRASPGPRGKNGVHRDDVGQPQLDPRDGMGTGICASAMKMVRAIAVSRASRVIRRAPSAGRCVRKAPHLPRSPRSPGWAGQTTGTVGVSRSTPGGHTWSGQVAETIGSGPAPPPPRFPPPLPRSWEGVSLLHPVQADLFHQLAPLIDPGQHAPAGAAAARSRRAQDCTLPAGGGQQRCSFVHCLHHRHIQAPVLWVDLVILFQSLRQGPRSRHSRTQITWTPSSNGRARVWIPALLAQHEQGGSQAVAHRTSPAPPL